MTTRQTRAIKSNLLALYIATLNGAEQAAAAAFITATRGGLLYKTLHRVGRDVFVNTVDCPSTFCSSCVGIQSLTRHLSSSVVLNVRHESS